MAYQKWNIYTQAACIYNSVNDSQEGRQYIRCPLASDRSFELCVDVVHGNVSILNGECAFRSGNSLKPGAFVECNVKNETIIIVITEADSGYRTYRNTYHDITVGCGNNCFINYALEALSDAVYYTISYHEEKKLSVLRPNVKLPVVYKNGVLLTEAAALSFGDEISVLGLSVVFLDSVIAVNNPLRKVTLRLNPDNGSGIEKAVPTAENDFNRTTRIYSTEQAKRFTIDPPATSADEETLPAALTIGPSITMGISTAASLAMTISNSTAESMIPGLIMTGAMLAGSLLWPNLTRKYEKKHNEEQKKKRSDQYLAYINEMEQKITANINDNLQYVNSILVPPKEISDWIDNRFLRRVWERSDYDDDFLCVRLGIGTINNPSTIDITTGNYQSQADPLFNRPKDLQEKYKEINDAPTGIDLKKTNSVGIIGVNVLVKHMVLNMVYQLSALHAPEDLKMAFVYPESEAADFDWVKKLPHVWNDAMDFRYIAGNRAEVQVLFRKLAEELESRSTPEAVGKVMTPAYVLFVMDHELTSDISFTHIVETGFEKSGFATVFAYGKINTIPAGCRVLIQCAKECSKIYDRTNTSSDVKFRPFNTDVIGMPAIRALAGQMASLHGAVITGNGSIPTNVTFLDLYRAGTVEQLDIRDRWQHSNPQKSLAVPIGMKSGGELFYLDIHEKYHGSHGLMAGTTGSGKSECLQALLLSLAVNFHPNDISFVIIDFKGGGMANSMAGLPHIAGTITNLGNQITRSMISIQAELKRRQRMLSEAGVNHIDKYQKLFHEGQVSEPMPHMVLVSDEFAELKQQQPEFMNQLISVARIGRSLGVHMILATQKPSGVVDDQIWSNTRFRICLKVADKSDSVGMIGSPLAATVTLPGRGYVQVGYNEVFESIQSGYTGAEYIPSDEYIDTETKQIQRIDGCGQSTGQAVLQHASIPTKKQSQLEATISYIKEYAESEKIPSHPIWTPPLSSVLSIKDVSGDSQYIEGAAIGLIDDPEMQSRQVLGFNPENGHLVMFGMPGSGKTTFLQTVIYSTIMNHAADEARFEIFDFGGRTLDVFEDAPHVNHVLFPDNMEEISATFERIAEEMERRRLRFAKFKQENLQKYISATGERIPYIYMVIDNFGKFWEILNDEAEEICEPFISLVHEGAKYGIVFILTCNTVNALSYKLNDYFTQKYALNLSDPTDYAGVVGVTGGIRPENVHGRGLCRYSNRICEFQVAIIDGETDDGTRNDKIIASIADKFGKKSTERQQTHGSAVGSAASGQTNTVSRRKGGGIAGLPGIGKSKQTDVKSVSQSRRDENVKSDALSVGKNRGQTFPEDDEKSAAFATDRKNFHVYALPLGESICAVSEKSGECDFPSKIAVDAIRKKLSAIWYYGNNVPEGAVGVASAEEISSCIDRITNDGSGILCIEDLMSFYSTISDDDLDRLTALIKSESIKITVAAACGKSDAQILKDYPLGVLLIKRSKYGLLFGGKPIDMSEVLPYALIERMTMAEREQNTGKNAGDSAILFDSDGNWTAVRLSAEV